MRLTESMIFERTEEKGSCGCIIGEDLDCAYAAFGRIHGYVRRKVSGIVDPRKVTKEEIGLMMIRTEQDGEKEEVTE